jgi:hypothetical protein
METCHIAFKPLYGVHSKHEPLCYLLVVDDLKILLDCGWSDDFDLSVIAPLARCGCHHRVPADAPRTHAHASTDTDTRHSCTHGHVQITLARMHTAGDAECGLRAATVRV